MKNLNKYIVIIISLLIIIGLIGCETKESQIKKFICGNKYKFWLSSNYELGELCFTRFDIKGNFSFFHYSIKKKEIAFAEETDVIYPKYWELKNDSTILIKWDKQTFYERKIIKINNDTLITSYRAGYDTTLKVDTLFTPPDSIRFLLKCN